MQNGNTFTINSKENSETNFYIQSTTLNGENYQNTYINASTIQKGGSFDFNLGATPNKKWGSKKQNAPSSLSN